jgi:hypothetical protein
MVGLVHYTVYGREPQCSLPGHSVDGGLKMIDRKVRAILNNINRKINETPDGSYIVYSLISESRPYRFGILAKYDIPPGEVKKKENKTSKATRRPSLITVFPIRPKQVMVMMMMMMILVAVALVLPSASSAPLPALAPFSTSPRSDASQEDLLDP